MPASLESTKGPNEEEPKEAQSKTHHNQNGKILRQRETLKGSKGERGSHKPGSSNKAKSIFLNRNTTRQKGMARCIPSNEKRRPVIKIILPTRLSVKMEGKIRSPSDKRRIQK